MTKFVYMALGASLLLSACGTVEVASRLDSSETLYSGFQEAGQTYMTEPVGARLDNDFMRFSTLSVTAQTN